MTTDPDVAVACPTCGAVAGEDCDLSLSLEGRAHVSRRVARLLGGRGMTLEQIAAQVVSDDRFWGRRS